MKPLVVTGYVKIPGHPRSPDEYKRLGAELMKITAAPIMVFDTDVLANCWLAPLVRSPNIGHSTGDNPNKNTLGYHVVQHQKTTWLRNASQRAKPEIDVLIWMDYGIFSQPGITLDVLDAFLRRVTDIDKLDKIFIPGAWERSNRKTDEPDWHFCGSSMIMPRACASAFHDAVRYVTLDRLKKHQHVTWEINDWAVVERFRWSEFPRLRWYQGDHNETQFTNFGAHLVTR